MAILSVKERRAIEEALAIIHAHTPEGASWQLGVAHYTGCSKSESVCFFSTSGTQITDAFGAIRGSFSDRIDAALQYQADQPPLAADIRNDAIAYHKAQLASLGVPA